MNQNRRRHLRRVPEKFGFVQIEGDEVGKVLNVSEGGLSFSSFNPVPQERPLYFWFSFNLNERIEAMGEVAWTNPTRKVGGLQFTHLPRESRRQIRALLSHLPAQQISQEELAPQVVMIGEQARTRVSEPDRVARFVAKARTKSFPVAVETVERADVRAPSHSSPLSLSWSNRNRQVADARPREFPATTKAPSRGSLATSPAVQPAEKPLVHPSYSLNLTRPEGLSPNSRIEMSGGLVSVERYYSAKRRQLIVGVFLGVCVSAGAIWAAHRYSNYRRSENAVVAASAESSPAKNETQARSTAPQSGFVPSAPAEDIFSGSPPIKSVVSANKQIAPSNAYSPFRSQAFKSKAPKQSTGAAGQAGLSGITGKRPMTPRQLWSAVQAGNSNAAVALADLYIQGEGVPKNCQQARVLLLMASEKRNPTAIKRLRELDKDTSSCP